MKRIIVVLLCVGLYSSLYSLVAGSEAAVSIQSYIDFPASDGDNLMRGFGWFKHGFALEDASTTCTFNSIYPVSGTVNMRGGTINLASDIYFSNTLDITGFGSIEGRSHSVYFPSNFITLPANAGTIQDTAIILSNDLQLSSTLSFKGTTTIKGNGNTIFLGEYGGLALLEDAHLVFEDVDIKNVGNGNIALANDKAHITFDDANLYFDGDLTFDKGSFLIRDDVHFYGAANFIYDSAQTSTLEQFSLWQIHDDMQLHVGKKESVFDSNPLWFEDQSSVLRLSNCHLCITQYGFDLLRGTIAYDSQVTLETIGETLVTGLMVGNGNIADDPIIQFDAGSSVRLESSQFIFNTGSPDIIKTGAHKNARLSRNIGSNVVVLNDLVIPSMKIEVLSEEVPPMSITPGKTVEYNDTLVVLYNAEFDITSGRRAQSSFVLNGNDSIFFTKGTLPFNLDIENSGNRIMGNGNIAGTITCKDRDAELITELDGEFNNTLILGGGTLQLDDDLRFGVSSHISGSGVVNLQEYSLHLPPKDFVLTSSINWQGQNAAIHLNGRVSLSTACTCSGTVMINGRGNVLEVLDTGVMKVASDSTLILKNIRLEGIKNTNFWLEDETSKLVLDNVLWRQADDYTFENGSIAMCHNVKIVGGGRFIYDSTQTSTISSYSTVQFTDGSSLDIGKKNDAAIEPLFFEDRSATLAFNGASLHVINDGLTLTRGLVTFDHEAYLDIDSTSTANGLTMGIDTVGEDITFLLNANTDLNFLSGHLTYNNYADTGFKASGNKSARFIRHELCNLYIKTNLALSNIQNVLVSPVVSSAIVAHNKTLTVNDTEVKIGRADFFVENLTQIGIRQHLTGDSSILMQRASPFPIPLFVSGKNNAVRGAGAIVAPIILADEDAQVGFDIQGEFRSFVQLNGGTILIDSNLDFGPDAQVNGSGAIDIDSQKVSLSATDMDWTSTVTFIANGGILELNADVSLNTPITVRGTLLFVGNGNSLRFKDGARIFIEDGSTVIYRGIRLESIEEKHITCLGPDSKIVLDDSTIILGDDLALDEGSISFVNKVDVIGSHTFTYDSKQTSTIKKHSVLHVSDGVLLKVGKTNALVDEPIHFEDRTSVLLLDNCGFLTTSSGIQFSVGTIKIDREVAIDIDSTSIMNGLVLGNGQLDDTLTFELSPGATVRFVRGHTVYNVPNPNAIVSLSPSARFIRQDGSFLHSNYSVALNQITLDHSKGSITTLAQDALISYENTTLVVPGAEFNTTGVQTNPLAVTLPGSGELFLNKGAYPLATVVSGSENIIHGNGNITGPIILNDATAELKLALNGSIADAFSLNNGTLKLLQDMHLARGIVAASAGKIDLGDHRFILGSKEVQWPIDIVFEGQSGEVTLNSDMHLSGTWTFTGECILNGNGNTLFLGDTGQINVARDATLTMKNVLIRDIGGDNIRCLDVNGLIVLDGVDWIQDDQFTFSLGAMQWNNQVTMSGASTFAYQTTRTSTLLRQSSLSLEQGFTFTYDPIESVAQDLITFEDDTSLLKLSDAHLATSLVGMSLARGSLIVSGDCTISADVIEQNDNILEHGSIYVGGTSVDTDFRIRITPGSFLRIVCGDVVYRNLLATNFIMGNELSTIALMPKTQLRILETLDIGIGRLEMSEQSSLMVKSGKEFLGSVFELSLVQ